MSKPQNILGALLVLQLLTAGGLYLHGRQQQAQHGQQVAILTFDKASIDKLVISEEKSKATLVKTGEGWELPDYQKLPVDSQRLDELLATLADLKAGWPVAMSPESHEQFEVSEQNSTRKISLYSGENVVAELYLGSSPGLRKTHVRNAQDQKVYAASLSSSDAPATDDQWLDRSLVSAKDPQTITATDYALKKEGGSWKLTVGQGSLNESNVNALVTALHNLKVISLQENAPNGNPTFKLEVDEGSQPLSYQFWETGDEVTLRRSDKSQSFLVAKPTLDSLRSFNLKKLTEPSESAAPDLGSGPTPTP